jgi:cell fate (sporulation/competence/biofilm development) regulator YlbF (YheA/YmcA/DUF963 family)
LKREKNGQRSLHDFFVARKEGAEEKSGSIETEEQMDDGAKVVEEETPSSDFEESSSRAGPSLAKRSKASIDLEAVSSAGNGSNHQEAIKVRENGEGGDGSLPSPSAPSSSQTASPISTKNASPADLEVTRRLQEKIDQLGQAMREGMDQIKFVQKEREAQRAVTASRRHPDVPVSPKSSHGHRPVPRLTADETKERKRKVADDFIQSLWPFMKQAKIGSKTAFKMLARELTHKALEREKRRGKAVRAEEVVTRFFAENKRITSDQEAKARLKAFRV